MIFYSIYIVVAFMTDSSDKGSSDKPAYDPVCHKYMDGHSIIWSDTIGSEVPSRLGFQTQRLEPSRLKEGADKIHDGVTDFMTTQGATPLDTRDTKMRMKAELELGLKCMPLHYKSDATP